MLYTKCECAIKTATTACDAAILADEPHWALLMIRFQCMWTSEADSREEMCRNCSRRAQLKEDGARIPLSYQD